VDLQEEKQAIIGWNYARKSVRYKAGQSLRVTTSTGANCAINTAECDTWRKTTMTHKELSSEISRLPKKAPVTAELQVVLGGIRTRNFNRAEETNPKDNWIIWLESYKGPYRRRKD
jgi:hypothetical protein